MSYLFCILIGVVIGWQVPQPAWASGLWVKLWDQAKVAVKPAKAPANTSVSNTDSTSL